tara:strand:- start:2401 stop:2637 length:237 start_codon:yes stop_codon:yes gene_type:complete
MGGTRRMVVDPKVAAQEEAEKTFELFMLWTKRVTAYALVFLAIVVVGCNSGVETGPNKTGSQYNGEQYNPSNLNVKEK